MTKTDCKRAHHCALKDLWGCPKLKGEEGAGFVGHMLRARAKVGRDVRQCVADAHDCNAKEELRVAAAQLMICCRHKRCNAMRLRHCAVATTQQVGVFTESASASFPTVQHGRVTITIVHHSRFTAAELSPFISPYAQRFALFQAVIFLLVRQSCASRVTAGTLTLSP